MSPQVHPLSYRHRNVFFYMLMGIFLAALPFLFLYASGYRFYFGDRAFVSTGGLYIAAERTGASIYINDELVRETRAFRRAFYAQGLEAKTHRITVQKEDHHTWVKELPVYAHLVTEAQSFNLPIVPEIRVITPYQTPAGVSLLTASSSIVLNSEVVNQVLVQTRASTSTMVMNEEYEGLMAIFNATSTGGRGPSFLGGMQTSANIDEDTLVATTTKLAKGVRLYEEDGQIFARYIGQDNDMPYYYCAEDFARYTSATTTARGLTNVASAQEPFTDDLILEVQTVEDKSACDPVIKIDTGGEEVSYFDFFPNSDDLVIIGSESGIYVVEIDDRAWQNRQPLLKGKGLDVRVLNGSIYAYDDMAIYQIQTEQSWF